MENLLKIKFLNEVAGAGFEKTMVVRPVAAAQPEAPAVGGAAIRVISGTAAGRARTGQDRSLGSHLRLQVGRRAYRAFAVRRRHDRIGGRRAGWHRAGH